MSSPGFEPTRDFSGAFWRSRNFSAAKFIRDGSMTYCGGHAPQPLRLQRIATR